MIDKNTPRKETLLFWGETGKLYDGKMNWKLETGYIYPYPYAPHEREDIYWGGYRLDEWDHKPTHWMKLPEPPK